MITLILLLVFFILLDVAALGWGYDSRDGVNSAEWARRQEWLVARLAHLD
jgi:hypothetical protein